MPERPSVQHHMVKVPTGPNASAADRDEAEATTIAALLRDPAGLSVESILRLLEITQRRAVIAAKQDVKLSVDTKMGSVESTVGTLVSKIQDISGVMERKLKLWRTIGVIATASAVIVATIAATVRDVYREAHSEVAAPAQRAELKADELERRVAESERRHDDVDRAISELRGAVEANTKAVLGIASKLDQPHVQPEPAPAPRARPR